MSSKRSIVSNRVHQRGGFGPRSSRADDEQGIGYQELGRGGRSVATFLTRRQFGIPLLIGLVKRKKTRGSSH